MGMRQLLTTSPFSNTAQAPHSPSPHPSFAPVSPNSSRRMSNNRASGWAAPDRRSPLTVKWIEARTPSDKSVLHGLHQNLRGGGNPVNRNKDRILDGIDDRRRGSVNGQLAKALRSRRTVRIRNLLEVHANRRKIRGGRHDVVRHLAIDHAPFTPDYIFIEGEADTLGYTAFDLPGGQNRIDNPSNLLHRNKVGDAGFEAASVHGNLGNVHRPRIRGISIAAIGLVIPVDPRWWRVFAMAL